MKKEIIIKCDCSCHAIQFYYDGEWNYIEVSIWERYIGKAPFSIKERLRWCWHILTTGTPWADHVVLSQEQIQQLIQYLNAIHSNDKPTK